MTTPTPGPTEPAPSALWKLRNTDWMKLPLLEKCVVLWCEKMPEYAPAADQLALLRSSLAEAVKRAEVAEAENKAMAEKLKWIDEFVLTVERKSRGLESLLKDYREKSTEEVNT